MNRVTVVSVAAPTIQWRCPSCSSTAFACSDCFRLNSNGKLVDIWLIYRCVACGATKNVTVVERTPVARVPRWLFAAATDNDDCVARRFARDVSLLRRAGIRIARGDEWAVEGARTVDVRPSSDTVVGIRFPEPLLVRLDDVVAGVLRVSRRQVARARVAQRLVVDPALRADKLRLWAEARVTWRGVME